MMMMMMMEMMPITRRSSCGGRKTDRQNANARIWRCDRLQYRRKSLIENGKGEEEVEERPFLRHRQSQRVCVCVWGRDDASFVAATASPENSQKKKEKKEGPNGQSVTELHKTQNKTKKSIRRRRRTGGGPRGGGGGDLYGGGKGKDFIGIRSLWLLNE